MLRFFKWLFLSLIILCGVVVASAWTNMGQAPSAIDKQKFGQSPQWQGQRFENSLVQEKIDMWRASKGFFLAGNPNSVPQPALEFPATDAAVYQAPPASGLRITWLGHSSLLLEVDGLRILVDPVWGERASPFSYLGAKRFYPVPLALQDLPPIDAILISHDHYDHLDIATVKRLKDKNIEWYMPLGVGSHLRHWGVAKEKIHELDWWQDATIKGVKFTAIPSRHSSGRSIFLTDTKKTLWSGWAINGPQHRVVYSGDTTMHPDFKTVGDKLGPFDLSIIEIGAYNLLWRDNHLGPEQALIAHQLLQAKTLLPVHWAGFDLATHGWTEPMERLQAAALKSPARPQVLTPLPGQAFELQTAPKNNRWWPSVPWQTAEQDPIWSTKVDDLIQRQ